uniref:Uncharacterized protein n=1 Tax=Daphnia galeata TaxID=27404 RepID=A0A8J2W2C4_9CRUS|nr:unnamed protein product [Daphnia galeata]
MKIALFVLSCFITVSRQQNSPWLQYHQQVPFQYHYPASHSLRQWSNIFSGSYPYYSYSRSQPQYVKYFPSQNPSVVLFKSSQQPEEEQKVNENQDELVNEENNQQESSIEARIAKPKGQARLFDNALLSNLLFGTVATSTKYSIATTTIVSTSVISCIPSASFSAGSTTACRRRRDLSVMKEIFNDYESLSPSQVQSVEPSAALTLDSLSDSARSARDSVTIVSSLEDRSNRRAGARFIGLNALLTLTTTSTLTTATISVTSSRKTVTIGSSLLCLPSGINLC